MSGPHDAGHYNSTTWETGFFVSQNGSWNSPYGHFFLEWYSGLLVNHADRILASVSEVLNRHGRPRVFKAVQEVRRGGPRGGARTSGMGQTSAQGCDAPMCARRV